MSVNGDNSETISLPGTLPGIDIDQALIYFMGNKQLLYQMLLTFFQDHKDDVQDIKTALDKGDFENGQNITHTLKGVANTIGAMELFEAAKALDSTLKQKKDYLKQLILLESILLPLLDGLERLKNDMQTSNEDIKIIEGKLENIEGEKYYSQRNTMINMEDIKKMTVLIVDDEKIIRAMLTNLLGPVCQIIEVKSGEQALLAANENIQPDLILLDVVMPEMDGYEVCRRLKLEPATADIPVIFITANSDVEEETKGFEMGAVDYITKPISPSIVKARVQTHLWLKHQTNLIKQWSTRDSLTGIANRRAFDEGCNKEWSRACRSKWPFSLVMIDIDMFKQFNDNYGHSAGDDSLTQVAQALVNCIHRPGDSIARYGGEEFVAILNNTDVDGAAIMGEAFRRAISTLNIPHAYSKAASYVTISVGCATCQTPSDNILPTALLKKADQMLYEAKNTGRNKVIAQNFNLT